jgi:hypothetical protein
LFYRKKIGGKSLFLLQQNKPPPPPPPLHIISHAHSTPNRELLTSASFGRKGEHFKGDPREAVFLTNVRASNYLTDSDVPFEEQITRMLDALEPKLDALKEVLSLPGVEGELFLGFGSRNGQGGAEFSPALLKRIAEYGLSLGLDLYPPSGISAEEAE